MQSLALQFGLDDTAALAWAHRVNTSARLDNALADDSLHMLEADVQMAEADAVPLVADKPGATELDVATLVNRVAAAGKGLKLDFHTACAVEPTLAILKAYVERMPLMLHADIFALLDGPGKSEGMEPEQFIRLCQRACPKAVLSIGWSLKRAYDADGRVEDALIQQISGMVLNRMGPLAYGIEIRAGYTPGVERGAALILDPLDPLPTPLAQRAHNVVDFSARLRRVA